MSAILNGIAALFMAVVTVCAWLISVVVMAVSYIIIALLGIIKAIFDRNRSHQ